MQAGLIWAYWAENRKLLLWHFKSKKQKYSINQCQNYFLTSVEMHGKNKILRLTLSTIESAIWARNCHKKALV